MKLEHARIFDNLEIAPGIFSMLVGAPEIAFAAHAGQFVMVYLESGELLLPRPISICDKIDNVLRLVYQVVGKGTEVMSKMKNGSAIKLLGPLGKGFFTNPKTARTSLKKVAIVGGGIGTPPLLLLTKTLKHQGTKVDAYLGFRTHPILYPEFENAADNLYIATEDGTAGHRGNILEVLQSQNTDYDEILACGPRPMLNALAHYANSKRIPAKFPQKNAWPAGLAPAWAAY